MKKGKVIITALALSMATVLYAGSAGMGCNGACIGEGEGKAMQKQHHRGCLGEGAEHGMREKGKSCRGKLDAKRMHRHPMHRMMQRMQKELNFSSDQKKSLRMIMMEYRQQMQSEHRTRSMAKGMGQGKGEGHGMGQGMKAQQGRMPLASVLGAEKFDKAAFAQLLEKRWAERDAHKMERRRIMLERMSDVMEKIHALLTPQQRKKLLELSEGSR